MQRAKHRASGSDAAVSVTALLERFSVAPAVTGSGLGVATLTRPDVADLDDLDGADPVGAALPSTGAMPVLDDAQASAALRDAVALFEAAARGTDDTDADAGPSFGAARHARSRGVPAPRISGSSPSPAVSQPVSAGIAATVLGAAAAVTAVVVPGPAAPSAVETTLRMAPVQDAIALPVAPLAPGATASRPIAVPEQPTVQIPDLVSGVRAQMQKAAAPAAPAVERPFANVANTTALSSSPAAMMRRAAMTTALGRLGKPYRWGAMGPNAFDCSGLVKWSFAGVGRNLPRTSRAMASVGTPVARRDLQPGDLVFFYQPISHVGIYIGNNKIVHASTAGQPVKVSDMTYMRFTTARRIT